MKAIVFTLGCKVNSCESASLMTGLKDLGYEVSDSLGYADLYILNTCAVTGEAEKKSRQLISRVKKFNKNCRIIITGCASEKSPSSFENKEGVTLITGAKSKEKILKMLDKEGVFIEKCDVYGDELIPENTDKTRSYVKVQDGCNNFCSYCIIPYLRGRSRSRSPESVVKEIECLKPFEVVITGINLSAYNYNGIKLVGLMKALKDVDCRIRLGSLEVGVIDDEFLNSVKELKNFAPHFHLSLQSGSNSVLKSMNRRYTREEYIEKCKQIYKYFPNAAITTDIIAGYSTETDRDFLDSVELAKVVAFADIHCFAYSKREGTVGAKLKELPPEIKKERLDKLMLLKAQLKQNYIEKNLGKTFSYIAETYADGYTDGYTENYIKTYVFGEVSQGIYSVKLIKPYLDGAIAEIIKE